MSEAERLERCIAAGGVVVLMYGIYLYLPTLPDPYVASYTARLRDLGESGLGQLRTALGTGAGIPRCD